MKRLVLIAMALWFTSCSDEGLFETDFSTSPLTLELPPAGQILSSGDKITPTLKKTTLEASADTMVQTLLNGNGTIIESIKIPIFLDQPLPAFIFKQKPSDGAKVLTLRMELFQKGNLVYRTDWPFFTVAQALPSFFIQSHPQEIYPGSTVLLEAIPASPFPEGAWLRWKLDKKVLQEGPVSQDSSLLLWQAPVTEGMYNITAEVFPLSPPEGGRYSFESPRLVGSRLVVTALESPEAKDFQPDSLFSSLFHFRGNLRDTGYLSKGTQATVVGPLHPDVYNGFFGYEFQPGAGIIVDKQPFPKTSDHTLAPFSLILRALPRPSGTGPGTILTMKDTGLGLQASLQHWPGKGFAFALNQGEVNIESVLPIEIKPGVSFLLTLSFIPGSQTSQALWYLNGAHLKTDTLAVSAPKGLTEKGSLLVGGTSSFEGIIDEIGILTRDSAGRPSVDPYAFSRALSEKYTGDLEFAEGFDGIHFPEGSKITGTPLISLGNLVLTPGSSLALAPLYPSAPWWTVEMQWNLGSGSRGDLSLFLGRKSNPILTLSTTGELIANGTAFIFPPFQQTFDLKLTFSPKTLRAQIRGQEVLRVPYDPSLGLIWQWSNPGKTPGNWTIPWFYIKKTFNPTKEIN